MSIKGGNTMLEKRDYEIQSENIKEICIISDLGYGSEKERLDRIEEIYKLCESKGVEIILNCGNLVSSYKTNEEIKNSNEIQSKKKIDYVVKNHPYSKKIKLYTISGTSDLSFLRKEDIDVCKEISKNRKDIIYLGKNNVDINVSGLKIKLYSNPIKNGFYSYTPQTIGKIIGENSDLDLICIGPDENARNYKYKSTNVLYIPSVSDNGYGHHVVWFVKIKTDKKDKTKKICSLEAHSLKSSYDRKIEEEFKRQKQQMKKINVFPCGITIKKL